MTEDGGQWEDVGRDLLGTQLELKGHHVQEAFDQVAARIEAGHELSKGDIEALREALEDARRVVKTAAEASPEASPSAEPWEFLTEDARREMIEQHDVQEGE